MVPIPHLPGNTKTERRNRPRSRESCATLASHVPRHARAKCRDDVCNHSGAARLIPADPTRCAGRAEPCAAAGRADPTRWCLAEACREPPLVLAGRALTRGASPSSAEASRPLIDS